MILKSLFAVSHFDFGVQSKEKTHLTAASRYENFVESQIFAEYRHTEYAKAYSLSVLCRSSCFRPHATSRHPYIKTEKTPIYYRKIQTNSVMHKIFT